MNLEYINGQTPLDEDEKEGLKIPTITTRGDLDVFEQRNIEDAVEWSYKNKFKLDVILTEDFIKKLHYKMFCDVWSWAGKFRNSNKNIGVDKFYIGIELRKLIDDCKFWIDEKVFNEDEIAIRFSHRVVQIHLFPNGNGRHSRLIGDIIVNHGFGKEVFTWGGKNLQNKGEAREKYLKALREADQNDYENLLKLARQ